MSRVKMVFPAKCKGEGCNHMLRHNKDAAQDWPGTRRHQARGLCTTCYTRERRGTVVRPKRAPDAVVNDARCVLVRVDLTPSTYRTLKYFDIDAAYELSLLADQMADKLRSAHVGNN